MSYKTLLFDIDDTLLDFGANETDSLKKLFQQHGYAFSDELFRVYNSVNKQLWADYENGDIILADVLNSRFSKTMKFSRTPLFAHVWKETGKTVRRA